MSSNLIAEISEFWLRQSLTSPDAAAGRRDFWYRGGDAVDNEIRERFIGLVTKACDGELTEWGRTPEGAFVLIILLDQFTRNMFRNFPGAYAGDALALSVVSDAIDNALDRELHPVQRIWLYHPFHHSEVAAEQDRGIRLLHDIRDTASEEWRPYIERSITGWTRHRNIVARFGRFPHRNHVLGRDSTLDESAFLEAEGESFGQGPRRLNDLQ